MSETKTIIDTICRQYSASPSLVMGTKSEKFAKEDFEALAADGTITIRYGSDLGGAYGAAFLSTAAKGGHVGELLGHFSPRYPLRPLWLSGEVWVNDGVRVAIPGFFTEEVLANPEEFCQDFCQRIIEFGYNAVIFGARNDSATAEVSGGMRRLLDYIRSCGIKVIIKPTLAVEESLCPVDPDYNQATIQALKSWLAALGSVDYVLWESCGQDKRFTQHRKAERYTFYDLIVEEAAMVEEALGDKTSLIYYVPSSTTDQALQQAKWLPKLCDDVGSCTTLAFSAVSGQPQEQWRGMHPVWEAWRRCPDVSSTPLLPIVNVGCVGEGEGLWPILSTTRVDEVLVRMKRHNFAGMVGIANHLPTSTGFLACSLFAAGQAQWLGTTARLAAETFLAANHPDLNNDQIFHISDQAYQMVLKLAALQEGAGDRAVLDQIFSWVKELENNPLTTHFVHDIKRLSVLTAKQLGIPCPNALGSEDCKGGFWTKTSQGASTAMATPATITMLETPFRDEADSGQAAVFDQNRQY